MRILEHYVVEFSGPCDIGWMWETYTIRKDDGTLFDVKIPGIPRLTNAFKWMSENDCLRHLREVEPDFKDNGQEIHEIETYNANLTEHAYLLSGLKSQTAVTNPWSQKVHVPGLRAVPAHEYMARWTFYSKEHAVMFKLACA
jgi:hypothetical protein